MMGTQGEPWEGKDLLETQPSASLGSWVPLPCETTGKRKWMRADPVLPERVKAGMWAKQY